MTNKDYRKPWMEFVNGQCCGEMADELSKFHAWEEARALVAKAREVVK